MADNVARSGVFGSGVGGGVGGSGGHGGSKGSWAQLLGSSLPPSWNKNVLEVVLEKDERGAFVVSDEDCARLLSKLGIDQRPGVHVEMVQICPNGRGVILITLKKEVAIDRFCRYDVLEVTATGIRTVLIKPAGKREVIVNMNGIHPNTRDDSVTDYLGKYGKLVSNKVIYGVFSGGPLKGLRNGDRAYKVEIKPNENIGSFHIIDGQKVTVRYAGQQQTCARCHETPQHCRGKGMARNCQAAGGPKVELTEYILKLWQKIGYTPGDIDLPQADQDDFEIEPAVCQQTGGTFTPVKAVVNPELYTGVKIKAFPEGTDHGAILEFLMTSGLAEEKKEGVQFKSKGAVTIMNLTSTECVSLISVIHHKVHFGQKLYCNGVIPFTPEKTEATVPVLATSTSTAPLVTSASDSTVPAVSAPQFNPIPAQPTTSLLTSGDSTTKVIVNSAGSPKSPTSSLNQTQLDFGAASVIAELDSNLLANEDLVRRHSISLRDLLPAGSIADEIIHHNLLKHRSHKLLDDIRDMSKKMSDFESARESLTDSSSDESIINPPAPEIAFETMNSRRRKYRNKRKNSQTPNKETFLKKSHQSSSPRHQSSPLSHSS